MPFRVWYYLAKVAGPILLGAVGFGLALPRNPVATVIYRPALFCLIALCLTGALLGGALAFGRLRMRCPFCGRYGLVGGNKEDGLWLYCDDCGCVHGAGIFGLRLVREQLDNDQPAS